MKNGFTLIEFLTVIVIIGILTAITIPNYQSARQKLALQRSAYKLGQDIRRAQEMAMSAKELPGGGGVPAGGYGIHFKQSWETYYKIYGDTNPSEGNEKYEGGDTQIGYDINLEERIIVYGVSPASSLSINFKSPDPTIKITAEGGGDLPNATITLCIKGADCLVLANTKTIKVNKVGLIYVE